MDPVVTRPGIGGAQGIGEGAANTMKLAADDVQSVVIPGCGHHCLEEAPEEVVAARSWPRTGKASDMSVVVVTAFPVPEHRAEVIAAVEAAIARVHGEPGVELYARHEGRDRLVIMEKYESERARSEHAKGAARQACGRLWKASSAAVFIHVRSDHDDALPLIVTHGWPGSVIEQLKIIGPLTNPTAHGATASDAFHLVIPSLPGCGFSGKPTATGWDVPRIARAWVVLMKRLGYSQFVSQGGDWGGAVTNVMAHQAPPELLGIHVNFPATVPPAAAKALQSGDPPPAGLSADERRAYEQLTTLYTRRRAYAAMMGTRPQTLTGVADSPVGLAAWLLDHGDGWGQPAAPVTSAVLGHTSYGHPAGDLTRDDVLDNITLYWLTNTGVSAARLYWENKLSLYNAADVSVPAAVSAFPGENYQAPRSWTERAYHNLIYYNQPDKGGHFAAWEQPQIFSAEVRAGFRPLRK